jgi:sulfur-oxidizing protein SoxA
MRPAKRARLLSILNAFWLMLVSANGVAQPAIDGVEFQSEETRKLQNDSFANPGLLWRDAGEALFFKKQGKTDTACAQCHGAEELVGAATRYPRFDKTLNRLINLPQRINWCRTTQQQSESLAYESEALLSLTTFIAHLSNGMQPAVIIDGDSQQFFAAGQDYYFQRRGQLNLACNHCHINHVGQQLRGDKLSQGHGNGYPAYRFEWQSLGSLHRRLRACNRGVRAEPFAAGSAQYVNLELYLAWRARELPLTVPAVRR